MLMLPVYRSVFISAVLGVSVGLLCFSVNYFAASNVMPGYELLTAPARLVLSFFTEELAFGSKMALFLSGQFFGYGVFALIFCIAYNWVKK